VFILVLVDGRRVSGVPLNYFMTGHAFATLAHAAAHKAHISHKNLMGYMGLNAGGAKVSLSWNNISRNTGNLLFTIKIPEEQFIVITINYGGGRS